MFFDIFLVNLHLMKPQLEHINIEETKQSFHFFKRSETVFSPYWHYHPELELTLIT